MENPEDKVKIQVIFKQFPSRHTSVHSHIDNCSYNISNNLCYVWTIKIKSFSNKHSNAMN